MPDCPNRPMVGAPSDNAALSAKITEMEKERRALMLRIVVRTKHGPQGRGDNGPCDKDCLKCEAELFLRKT